MSFGASTLVRVDEDRVLEGFRVPPHLNTVQNVTFVLTQEPGKLKPKDLKVAIERNRAEKEQRAEEQKKLRDEGGGAGSLDLRGILSEERLNAIEGDPFKRQLREMAFLADVEDVEKLEVEKSFRISEDYLGSSMLSAEDINIVYKQRRLALLHKKRGEWRTVQSRMHTGLYPPTHPAIKAGASAETAQKILACSNPNCAIVTAMSPPHFDPNRNDVWAKRMNTLRKFISLVGKWLIRKRVTDRMAQVMALFAENKAFTREEIRHFIENVPAKQQLKKGTVLLVGSDSNNAAAAGTAETTAAAAAAVDRANPDRPASVSSMVFSEPNPALANREHNAQVAQQAAELVERGESEITSDMARRILFPRCNPSHGGSGSREMLPAPPTDAAVNFDDRTYLQLKIKPDYLRIGYLPEPYPTSSVYFPTCINQSLRLGAPEEWALRPAADAKANSSDMAGWLAPSVTAAEHAIITAMRSYTTDPAPPSTAAVTVGAVGNGGGAAAASSSSAAAAAATSTGAAGATASSPADATAAIVDSMPHWLAKDEDLWEAADLDFLHPSPALRSFAPLPRRSEMDADWILRPDSEAVQYEPDTSLRTRYHHLACCRCSPNYSATHALCGMFFFFNGFCLCFQFVCFFSFFAHFASPLV
jgi:hypothetical protein